MIEFCDGIQPNRLVVNWENEPSGYLELIIAPVSEPYTINPHGNAIWSDPDRIGGVMVDSKVFLAALEEIENGATPSVTLPVFLQCQSQLHVVASSRTGFVQLQIVELYEPVLALTYLIDASLVRSKLNQS